MRVLAEKIDEREEREERNNCIKNIYKVSVIDNDGKLLNLVRY
jgi:hypothetical protein